MSRKAKIIVFICALVLAVAIALACALPYAFFLQAFLLSGDGDMIYTAGWVLYVFVAVLLWLLIWRMSFLAVKMYPRRKD